MLHCMQKLLFSNGLSHFGQFMWLKFSIQIYNEIRVFAARSRRQKPSWTEPPERFSPLGFYLCLSGCL